MRIISKTDGEIVVEPETSDEIAMADQLVKWRYVEVTRRPSPQQMLNTLNQSLVMGQMANHLPPPPSPPGVE